MTTNTKIIVAFFILVIAGVSLYFYFHNGKANEVTTTNQTKTGLGALNLSSLLSGLFSGPKTVSANNLGQDPVKNLSNSPEPRGT